MLDLELLARHRAVVARLRSNEHLRQREGYTYEALWRLRWLYFARSNTVPSLSGGT